MEQVGQFVFVVCGEDVHIHTLNYALPLLRRFSRRGAIVVTDLSRNAIPIEHDVVIDVEAPRHLTNHEAAIYLKTSLHRHLDMDGLYCYLDTDVLAISPEVDGVFKHFHPPVTFCTDHCRMPMFSPSCVYHPGTEALLEEQRELDKLRARFLELERAHQQAAGLHYERIKQIKEAFNRARPRHSRGFSSYYSLGGKAKLLASKLLFKALYWGCFLAALPLLPFRKGLFEDWFEQLHQAVFNAPFHFQHFARRYRYRYDPKEQLWYDAAGKLVFDDNVLVKAIEQHSEFRWDRAQFYWKNQSGRRVSWPQSDALRQLIRQKFGVAIPQKNWQHWNGGVFLFDKRSIPFLEQWRAWCLDIFEDPLWKTRDQGALIATAWKFGLQDHPTLPIEYNFIADYYHPRIQYLGDFAFQFHGSGRVIRPFFLHIYHHFGDRSWGLWLDVERMAEGPAPGM